MIGKCFAGNLPAGRQGRLDVKNMTCAFNHLRLTLFRDNKKYINAKVHRKSSD